MFSEIRFFIKYLFLFISLVILIVLLGCERDNNQSNFNYDFEINPVQHGNPNSWFATRLPQTQEFVQFAWDSTAHHSGSYSISISIDSTHPQNPIAYNWTKTFADFVIDKQYLISGWIKTMNLSETAWIVVQCWDDNQKMIGFSTTQNTDPVKGTTDWTLVKTNFTVPAGTKEVRIRAGISSPQNNGGKVWFDDIKIE